MAEPPDYDIPMPREEMMVMENCHSVDWHITAGIEAANHDHFAVPVSKGWACTYDEEQPHNQISELAFHSSLQFHCKLCPTLCQLRHARIQAQSDMN
jgi:hypothetical protein